jgi:hypothetical protein
MQDLWYELAVLKEWNAVDVLGDHALGIENDFAGESAGDDAGEDAEKAAEENDDEPCG